jgi:hypothetical protein
MSLVTLLWICITVIDGDFARWLRLAETGTGSKPHVLIGSLDVCLIGCLGEVESGQNGYKQPMSEPMQAYLFFL